MITSIAIIVPKENNNGTNSKGNNDNFIRIVVCEK